MLFMRSTSFWDFQRIFTSSFFHAIIIVNSIFASPVLLHIQHFNWMRHETFWYSKRDRISFLLELKFKFGWLLWNFRRKKRVDFFAEICADFAYAVRIYKYLNEEKEEEDKMCSIPFHT